MTAASPEAYPECFLFLFNFCPAHKNMENIILSSALQELLMYLETISMFLNSFSFSQQLLQHCQVTFSRLINLPCSLLELTPAGPGSTCSATSKPQYFCPAESQVRNVSPNIVAVS